MTNSPDQPGGDGLLPCPFCGGEPKCNGRPGSVMGQIYCDGEECFGPRTTALTKRDSTVQWNTRATRDAAEGARDIARCIEIIERSYAFASGNIPLQKCGEWIYLKELVTAAPPQPAPDAMREASGAVAAEPVAWRWQTVNGFWGYEENNSSFPNESQPLYTATPTKRDTEAIARLIYKSGSPSDPKDAWKEAYRVADAILAVGVTRCGPFGSNNGREPTPDMRIAGGIAWSEASKTTETFADCADACWKAMWDAR